MSGPVRWQEEPSPSPELAETLEALGNFEPPPWNDVARHRVWAKAVAEAQKPCASVPRWPLVLAGLCLIAISVPSRREVKPSSATVVAAAAAVAQPAPLPELAAAPDAKLVALPDGSWRLTRGQVRGTGGANAGTLRTPHLELLFQDSRFLVEVSPSETTLFVEEGMVQVRTHGKGARAVKAGERIRVASRGSSTPLRSAQSERVSPAAPIKGGPPEDPVRTYPVQGEAVEPAPAPSRPCASASDRRGCLNHLSEGPSLDAQNALFELGLIARDEERNGQRALALWSAYLERYPQGVLAPDALLGVMAELARAGRAEDAKAAAHRFITTYPGDPRRQSVQEWANTFFEGSQPSRHEGR